jgi:signal transduction histidine kinase
MSTSAGDRTLGSSARIGDKKQGDGSMDEIAKFERTSRASEAPLKLDAAAIGAGVADLYQLPRLRSQRLAVKPFNPASDVGGTGRRNRYPGAGFDSEGHTYQYLFSEDLYKGRGRSEKLPGQPESGEVCMSAEHEVASTLIDMTERKGTRDEQQRLLQLEADLAHVNRLSMMGELTVSLAHEITQPIATAGNNARAALNFLNREPPDLGEVGEALRCIADDVDRAGQIIDRIREHIKKAPPRYDRLDLNEAINEVIGLTRSAIATNQISLQTRLAEGLLAVWGDRVQLQQVVLNLILNAVEAMSAVDGGMRELSLSTEQSQTYGVLVAVRDSGPGIDSEGREQVFDAFYTTKSSGLGMGLSICRSIISAHGGRLWADANEPRGAVFQFTLPIAERNS